MADSIDQLRQTPNNSTRNEIMTRIASRLIALYTFRLLLSLNMEKSRMEN